MEKLRLHGMVVCKKKKKQTSTQSQFSSFTCNFALVEKVKVFAKKILEIEVGEVIDSLKHKTPNERLRQILLFIV